TEALLYAAARAQLVAERLQPLLAGDMFVILDRFVDSSLAYQGAGRALGIEDVRTVNAFATGGLRPDRTLLLRISPSAGRARQQGRAREQGGLGEAGAGPDRLEREDDAFFEAIGAAYEQLAQAEPQRIRSIDASQAPDEVLRDAIAAIEDLVVASSAEPRG